MKRKNHLNEVRKKCENRVGATAPRSAARKYVDTLALTLVLVVALLVAIGTGTVNAAVTDPAAGAGAPLINAVPWDEGDDSITVNSAADLGDLQVALNNPAVLRVYFSDGIALTGTLSVNHSVEFYAPEGGSVVLTVAAGERHFDVTETATLSFYGVQLDGNGNGGGVIFSEAGENRLVGANITRASNSAQGGAVRTSFASGVNLSIEQSTITDSSATGTSGNGGGVFSIGNLAIIDSVLTGNTASEQGGGAYALGVATVSGSKIAGNSAQAFGSGVVGYAAAIVNGNTEISGNTIRQTTGDRGGAVFSDVDISVIGENIIVSNNILATSNESRSGGVYAHGNVVITGGDIDIFNNGDTSVTSLNGDVTITGTGNGITFKDANKKAVSTSFAGTARINDIVTFTHNGGAVSSGHSILSGDYIVETCTINQVVSGGIIELHGGVFRDNGTPTSFGNGLFQTGYLLTADGTTFLRNKANGYGAIGFFDNQFSFSNCVFDSNENYSGDNYGGLIYTRNTQTEDSKFENCKFVDNYLKNGSAVFSAGRNLTVSGCTFTRNKTDGLAEPGYSYGAAIHAGGSTVITDSKFYSNTSARRGAVTAGNYIKIDGCTFEKNVGSDGGAVFVSGSLYAEILNSTFDSNSTHGKNDGGGIYLSNNSTNAGQPNVITNCTITNNIAGDWGGGVRVGPYAAVTIVGGRISGNISPNDGAGIYIRRTASVAIPNTITNTIITGNNAAHDGGGIYITPEYRADLATSGVTFADNTAGTTYAGRPLEADVAAENAIGRVSLTTPFVYALNNADVNYGLNASLKIIYNGNGASGSPIEAGLIMPHTSADLNASSLGFARQGYTFVGWSLTPTEQTAVTSVDFAEENVNVYAIWTINRYTVKFDVLGGSPKPADQTVSYGDLAAAPDVNPTRDNYTFGGWFREAAAITPWAFDADMVTDDITLYAKWTAVVPMPQPSATLAPSPSPEESPSPTPEESPELSPDVSPTPSETPTPTAEPTATPTVEPVPEPSATPTVPGVIVVPSAPNVAPPTRNDGATLVPNDDGGFIEFDEDGTPLGDWHYDDEIGAWVYTPARNEPFPPRTGDAGAMLWVLTALAAGCVLVLARKRNEDI
ncbi:MAG: InlB B-repeat-containing protein [Oscillospiraceae bacterium]|nr:InlB B-repeat-containing protein [Oscillospiraceae bacterium]